jgi:hypothetical protein
MRQVFRLCAAALLVSFIFGGTLRSTFTMLNMNEQNS